ncbi:DUF5080 family protein [Staphylococcus aureus]
MTLKSTPQITAETRDLSIRFSYSAYFIIIIFPILGFNYRVEKRSVCFCCNKANLFSCWLFILNMILSRLV